MGNLPNVVHMAGFKELCDVRTHGLCYTHIKTAPQSMECATVARRCFVLRIGVCTPQSRLAYCGTHKKHESHQNSTAHPRQSLLGASRKRGESGVSSPAPRPYPRTMAADMKVAYA